MFASLPEGCEHLAPKALKVGFASWSCAAPEEAETRGLKVVELAGEGLELAGEAHHCQTDAESGLHLWVAPLRPAAG